MATHRYWKVEIDTVLDHGRNCRVAASIEFYTSRFGPDVTISAPGGPICSNETYGAKGNAFDHNASTIWHNGCDESVAFIGWDFGPTSTDWPDIQGFMYQARGGGYGSHDSIETGGLYYSDDGSAYTNVFNVPTQSGWNDGDIRFFYDPARGVVESGGFRFWKLAKTVNTGHTYSGFSGAQFSTAGGVSLTSRVGTESSSLQAGSVAAIFADPTSNTQLAQWNDDLTNYMTVDFLDGFKYKVGKIKLWPNHDDVLRTWLEIDVLASNDDLSYTLIDHISADPWVAATPQEFIIGSAAPRRRASVIVC